MPPSRVPCSAVTGGCRPTSYGVKGNFYAGKEMGLTWCKYISFSCMYSMKKGSAEGGMSVLALPSQSLTT